MSRLRQEVPVPRPDVATFRGSPPARGVSLPRVWPSLHIQEQSQLAFLQKLQEQNVAVVKQSHLILVCYVVIIVLIFYTVLFYTIFIYFSISEFYKGDIRWKFFQFIELKGNSQNDGRHSGLLHVRGPGELSRGELCESR